ncbi:YkvA family protein [Altibacter sp.]|uniref:YkvA family protein n=1 Tax=Altibacter sp. TaxID=2024823 RepID=UPI0025C648DB|nr:YkvA family protein [Altibacter sp.]|tara:strand:+ start:394 stop:819 length:426 start_codon:yes stop_codon:yes gene_type:complete
MLFRKNKSKTEASNDAAESYAKEKITKVEDGDVEILMENQEAISKKLSNASPLSKYLEIGKLMMAMVKDMKNGNYSNVPWFTIATIVMALLYVLNPMDLVPDFIPGIGYLDDLAILSIGIGWIESDLHRYLDWKLQQGKGI